MGKTNIEWCDFTFNHVIGCTKVAAGCANCYAEADMDKRRGRVKWGAHGTRSKTSEQYWRQPLKWNREAACCCRKGPLDYQHEAGCPQRKRPRVFCASLADVFEDWQGPLYSHDGIALTEKDLALGGAPVRFPMELARLDLFELIDKTPNLDWLLLTKRPENIRRMWQPITGGCGGSTYRSNCWLGTSIATQADADKNIPELLKCRDLSPVLFVSAEPLIEAVDLDSIWPGGMPCPGRGAYVNGIDWVIVGGESGPHARPFRATWARDIVRQCADAGVKCFVKQLGSNAEEGYGANRKLFLKDKKGGDWSEWPEDLRVREFPTQSTRDVPAA